jgi:hypothetical protein
MNEKRTSSNTLRDYVTNGEMKSKSEKLWLFTDARDTIIDFPRLTIENMIKITLGTYRLRRARCYVIEHSSFHGAFPMEIARLNEDILMVKIQSKHSNRTQYDVWLQYANNQVSAWFCRCEAALRDLGCCSHVTALFYYLGYPRHKPEVLKQRASNY